MADNLTPTFFTVDHFDDFNEIIFLGGGPEPVVVVASLSPVGGKIRENVFDFESSEVEDDGAEIGVIVPRFFASTLLTGGVFSLSRVSTDAAFEAASASSSDDIKSLSSISS